MLKKIEAPHTYEVAALLSSYRARVRVQRKDHRVCDVFGLQLVRFAAAFAVASPIPLEGVGTEKCRGHRVVLSRCSSANARLAKKVHCN